MTALPITVDHALPAPRVEVIPAALVERMQSTLAIAGGLTQVDETNIDAASSCVVGLHALQKEIVSHVETIKAPLNAVLKAVRACADNAEGPVHAAKTRLQGQIGAYSRALALKAAAEAERVAAEKRKAQEAADAETRRLQAEANAKAEAQAKEAADLIGEPVVVKAEVVAPVKPVEVAPAAVAIPSAPSPVVTRKEKRLVIHDPRALATAYQIGDQVLVMPNNMAVRRCLDAGLAVPGARYEEVEVQAMRATR